MSTVDTMDPTTFTVPSGQALLYTEVSGSETLFKYKLSSGTTGTVNTAILTALGVKSADLPVLIYQTDLLACLNESFATVADLTIATGTKASIDYVKKMAATKVNKSDYLTRMAQTPTVSDLETSLSAKADQSDVESALSGKADASNVYSKEETNSLIVTALAGKSAVADQVTIEGAGTDVNPLTLASAVKTQLSGLEADKHQHSNISVLNKFSEDVDGNPLYNGSVIVGGGTGSGDSNIIESISLNGERVEITDKNANITIDFTQFAEANHNHVFADVDGLTDLEATVSGAVASVVGLQTSIEGLQTSVDELEEKAHVHSIENNFEYNEQIYACTQNSEKYKSFQPVTTVQNGYGAYAWIDEATSNVIYTGALNGAANINVYGDSGLTNVLGKATSGSASQVVFGGVTYKRSAVDNVAAVETKIEDEDIESFSFIGVSDPGYYLVANDEAYLLRSAATYFDNQFERITGSLSNIQAVISTSKVIAAIADGALYARAFVTNPTAPAALVAFPNEGWMQSSITTLECDGWTQIGIATDWKSIEAMNNGFLLINESGNLYIAGYNEQGIMGEAGLTDGANVANKKVHDLTLFTIDGVSHNDWIDASMGRYFAMGMRGTVDSDGNKRGTIYAWGSMHTGCLGNGVAYKQDFNKVAQAWVNDDVVIYTQSTATAAGTAVYELTTQFKQIGTIESGTAAAIVVEGITYTRDSSLDKDPATCISNKPIAVAIPTYDANGNVTATTVVDDWFAMSAGWYHAGAIRKNANGESEVYLWGENEYGQLGNGNYVGATMTQSSLSEANAALVEIVPYPHKLTSTEFPYTDAVKIECNHYGTIITRANGDVYFAGVNKRNFLGTGTFSDDTAFVPKFTKLSALFNDGFYAMSYGAMRIRKAPRLGENPDVVLQAVFADKLTPENLDAAVVNTHAHAIDTSIIDVAALMMQQYASVFPVAMSKAHSHTNLSALNSLSVRNNVLSVNNVAVGSASAGDSAGVVVAVDPSNVMLDTFCDVAGMSNIAGGIPLEILSYRVDGDQSIIWFAPLGGSGNQLYDRYMTLGTLAGETFTEIIPESVLQAGIYAKPSNGTGALIASMSDLNTVITTVLTSSSATLNLYYIDPYNQSSYTSGAQPEGYESISYAALAAGELYAKDPNTGRYIPLNMVPSVGLGAREPEEEALPTVYDKQYNVLITKDQFADEANTYYIDALDNDGNVVATEVTNLGMIVEPKSSETVTDEETGEEKVEYIYHTVYSDSSLSTVVISSEVVKAGLYTKVGATYLQVKVSDKPEEFTVETIEQSNGVIYINPGRQSLIGVANQVYEFDTTTAHYEMDTTDATKVKSVMVRLTSKLTNYDDTTAEPTFTPGSVASPMTAAIYSQNRSYTSTVNGEFNAAIGYNAQATGNLNNVFGDYSFASGIANTVTGSISAAFGDNNVVVGNSSYGLGASNVVAGNGNYVIGCGNKTHGYYGIVLGSMNETHAIDGFVIGTSNRLFGSRTTTIGTRNTMQEKATNSITIGNRIDMYAEKAVALGQCGSVGRFEGNFPGEDLDNLYTITAAGYASAGYDSEGIANKNGLFICAGDPDGAKDVNDFVPVAFTKYLWQANDAFFGAATGSANRSNLEPYIYKPFFQWTFSGVLNQSFVVATPKANDVTQFDVVKRNGGRVKSFDPGVDIVGTTDGEVVELDFNTGTRWKVKSTTGAMYLCGKHFTDGAEAYVIVYAGAEVYIDFTGDAQGELSDDATQFGTQVFVDMTGSNISESDLVTAAAQASSGFAMFKLMVVDDVMIVKLIANTLE